MIIYSMDHNDDDYYHHHINASKSVVPHHHHIRHHIDTSRHVYHQLRCVPLLQDDDYWTRDTCLES